MAGPEILDQLSAVIAERRRRPLSEIVGKVHFAPDYDHKRLRANR